MPDLKQVIRREVYRQGLGIVQSLSIDGVELDEDEMTVTAAVVIGPQAEDIVINIVKSAE